MLTNAFIYLLAAIIAVPIAKKLGLGSVLGYLVAGMVIGPHALRLVGDQTEVMHVAEFGVVIMLFLVGLELQPSRLWSLRKSILGLGGLQVALTAFALAAALWIFAAQSFSLSLAVGLTLALSSTAIVLQTLSERGLLQTQAGNNAFSVLLFQDIAIIPILALLPVLATFPAQATGDHHSQSVLADLPVWGQILATIGVVGAIVIAGRYISSPLFRMIAETRLRELFTALALLIVVAIAVLMTQIGLSAALGTFVAGVVLADSEFRHEIEVDIEPFKGLLLGLFFITVGANVDFQVLIQHWQILFLGVVALILIKALILLVLAAIFKMERKQGLLFALILAQGGEFAFVLTAAGLLSGVFDQLTANLVVLTVALSMFIAPLLLLAYEAYFSRLNQHASYEDDAEMEATCDVIIAGYGRFGQIVGRLLAGNGFHLTVLDHSPSQIDILRRFGNTVYYGDASRADLLEAAGAKTARLLVIGVDEGDKTLEIITTAKKHFPHLKILARAIDRRHAYEILKHDIDGFQRETFGSALRIGESALKIMGFGEKRAAHVTAMFAEHDEESLEKLAMLWGDDKSYGLAVRQRMEDLAQVLANDKTEQEWVEDQKKNVTTVEN